MKILIVDDHRLFCEGLRFVLQKLDDGVEILEANDHDSALAALAENTDLDFVMLDLHLADKDGFSVLEYARKHHKSLPVMVLTGSKEVADMRRAIDGGALGFVPKDSSGEQMLVAVRVVLAGGVYLPAEMNAGGFEIADRGPHKQTNCQYSGNHRGDHQDARQWDF